MKNLKAIITSVFASLITIGMLGCSSSSVDNGPKVFDTEDVSGIYRTAESSSSISSVTSVRITNGRSAEDLEAVVLRNGLSSEEYAYFNTLNEVQWADTNLGRELSLKNFAEGSDKKNEFKNETSYINVCSDKVALNSHSMDFKYCISLEREKDSLTASGVLSLVVYEFGKKINTIDTQVSLFIKDRWFVDYYGNWSGDLSYKNGNVSGLSLETGNALYITFQPVTEIEYILRPVDSNQTIYLNGEEFVLFPNLRPMSELEENANPYINFVYVSSANGARTISFNSYITSGGLIAGNAELLINGISSTTLATYTLNQE